MSRRVRRWLAAALPLAALGGCGHDPVTPAGTRPTVVEQSTSLRQAQSPFRTVVRGDTLYSIAWEAGRDYRELAAWNGIRAPFTIVPGQQLRVLPPAPGSSSASAPPRPATRPPPAAKPKPKPATTVPAKPAPAAGARTGSARPGRTTKPAAGASVGSGSWAWPTDGQIINRYGQGDSKGLDIAGAPGTAIRAAANGRVVYQGSGLRGYGQLIIVKHSDEFLSAYAHNDRIYVKEGDVVKRGQKIADMGSTGTDRVKLHFEIRHRGVPIDPLRYLPKR